MTTFRKGDKVRLDVEGVVVTSDKHGTQVRLSGREAVGNGGDNYFFDDSLLTLEKLAVKVGDEIDGWADANELPVGSVVLYEIGGGASLKRDDGKWATKAGVGRGSDRNGVKLRVLHIGTGA